MNNDKRIIARVARTFKTLLLGAMVAMTCSCEDFLTISPTDKIVLEDFWKSKADVENVVAESYRLMTQFDVLSRVIVWGELRGDNVVEGNYGGNNDIKNIMEANLLPTNSYNSWAPFYKIINNSNIVLKYAPGVLNEDPDFTQGDLDVVSGEMLALRALCHFYLVRTFRDIPLLTEAMVDDSQNLYQLQVSPIVALDSCLADLKRAENLVLTTGNYPDDKNPVQNRNMGRITKDAVRTIIADVCLWKAAFLTQQAGGDASAAMEWYNECINYCDVVLNTRMKYAQKYMEENRNNTVVLNDKYPILYPSDANEGYSYKGRFPHMPYKMMYAGGYNGCNNPVESIFELQHTEEQGAGNYEVPYFYSYSDDGNACKVGMLSASRHLSLMGKGRLYWRTDFRRVNNVFSQANAGEDLDKYIIIKYAHYSASENRDNVDSEYNFGKISYKFSQHNTGGGMKYYSGASNLGKVNWMIYRISDVMLMKAEALALRNAGGDAEEARNIVKAIYNRSQTGYMNGPSKVGILDAKQDDFDLLNADKTVMQLVLDERQRELAFEGKRWYDLVRVALRDNSTSTMLTMFVDKKYEGTSTEQYSSKMATLDHLFFPIAENELKTNPGLIQNKAYEKANEIEKN